MTTFENTTIIQKPISEVYTFLADLNNHEQLMPDNIYNWSSTENEARFTVKNMAKLAIKVSQRVEDQQIILEPSEKAPFDLILKWKTYSESAESTKVSFTIEADLNMMMKMMASGPLQKLVDYQVNQLKVILS